VIRIGLIGTGYIARRAHLPNFARIDGARVTALHNRTRAKAASANADFCGGSAALHDSWQDLVSAPNVDAVSICTPVNLHAEQAIAAARAGKHILVEKPMARTLAEADAMIAAADQAGVILMVDHGLRYYPPYVEVQRMVASGKLGPVHSIGMFAGHTGAERRSGGAPPWYSDPNQGGGCFFDLGIHEADMMRWLAGQAVSEVSAFYSTRKKDLYGGAEDNAVVNLRFDGGVLGNIRESWTLRPGFERRALIVLEGGFLTVSGERVTVHEGKSGQARELEIPGLPGHGNDKRHFIACVRTGGGPLTDGREGRESLAVVLAASESARTGKIVRL
jgi:predicted dehydrogenase